MIGVYKVACGVEDVRLEDLFDIATELDQLTRHSDRSYMIIKPKFKTNIREYFFLNIRVCDEWNNFPNCAKEASNLTQFKIACYEYLSSS